MYKLGKMTDRVEFVLLMLLGILWGIPYALTKIALTTIPPMTMVAARVSLASIVLWIIVFALKCDMPKERGFIPRLFFQGWLACILPYTLLAFGQRSVDSALTAILNSTTPLFVCLISLIWTRHETLSFGRLFGIAIGMAGVVMIAGTGALPGTGQSAFGLVMVILATVASAFSVIHGRRFAGIAPEIAAAGTLTSAALVLVPLSFIVEAPLQTIPSAASATALAVNAIVATGFGFILYFRLIRTIGSMGTASVGYLKLAVGVSVGCTLMGETLTWSAAVGFFAILLGVAAINQSWSFKVPRLTSRLPSSLAAILNDYPADGPYLESSSSGRSRGIGLALLDQRVGAGQKDPRHDDTERARCF
jgi:drug/metabolite transporter (DMT)-like permease